MKKNLLIITWSIMMLPDAKCQSTHAVENYSILHAGNSYLWVPVIHYKHKGGFYAEGRYNYEAEQSGSIYAGYSWEGSGTCTYSLTPMLGVVAGKYKGWSAAANLEIEYSKLNFSGQLQYTMHQTDKNENFFYNWSELSYQFFKKIYGGISIQQTMPYRNRLYTETGLLLGFTWRKYTVPFYFFNPLKNNRNLVAGFVVEWN